MSLVERADPMERKLNPGWMGILMMPGVVLVFRPEVERRLEGSTARLSHQQRV